MRASPVVLGVVSKLPRLSQLHTNDGEVKVCCGCGIEALDGLSLAFKSSFESVLSQ